MAEERTNRLVTRDEKRSYYEIGENYHEMGEGFTTLSEILIIQIKFKFMSVTFPNNFGC